MNRRRLDFEALRDSLLAVAGELDRHARRTGGRTCSASRSRTAARFMAWSSGKICPDLFRTFDFANPDTHSPQRTTTTVPQQALFLLNSPFVIEQATALAGRAEVRSTADARERVVELYRLVLGRAPSDAEIRPVLDFVSTAGASTSPTVWRYGYGPWDEAGKNSRRSTSSPIGPATIGKADPESRSETELAHRSVPKADIPAGRDTALVLAVLRLPAGHGERSAGCSSTPTNKGTESKRARRRARQGEVGALGRLTMARLKPTLNRCRSSRAT